MAGGSRARWPGDARRAQAASAASLARVLDLRHRAAGGELAHRVAGAAVRSAAGEDRVLAVLPVRSPGGPGQVDLVEGRHDQRDVHDQGPLPAGRRESDPDDSVLDPGPSVLEQQRADGAAAAAQRAGQRPEPEPGDVAAGRDPARVRSDAVARGSVCAVGAARPGWRRRPWRARQLRALAGAAGGPGEDPGDVR